MDLTQPRRVGLMDELRGLSILLMVIYHGAYDLIYLFGLNIPIFFSPVLFLLRDLFAGLFIVISGAACNYSHSNIKRGALCLGCGLIISLVTILFLPSEAIWFGILHFLGISMLLYGLCHQFLCRIPPAAGLVISLLLFFVLRGVPDGCLGIPGMLSYPLPNSLYTTSFLYPLGLPDPDFFSSDYFPLLPWLFLFLFGSFVGVYLKRERFPDWVYRTHLPFLVKVGRHTLLIYVLHQPVLYMFFSVLQWLISRF